MLRLTILFSIFGLNQCNNDETVGAYGASDHMWVLVELNGEPFPQSATLQFPEPGKIAGQGPCNGYSGAMTAPYPWFEAEQVVSTRLACPDLAAETVFFTALNEMTLSEVSGSMMILSNDAGHEMVFKADE